VRDRENLRFERTRVFGRVRRIFVELGRRLHALDVLDDPRDIFYLEAEESLGFVEGTAVTTDLKALARIRRAEFETWRAELAADRFETRGVVYVGHSFEGGASAAVPSASGSSRKGIGCCPGTVRGRARVILDPRNALIERGEILVAPRTDPGWIMLFPSAAGLLVEHGSLLSHSAIVAREMGIPAVVSIEGLTSWLATGDEVELDGRTGVVTRIERTDAPEKEALHV
jgi:pyruvate,water dikinase